MQRTCGIFPTSCNARQKSPPIFGRRMRTCDFYVPNGRALRGCAHTKLSHTSFCRFSFIASFSEKARRRICTILTTRFCFIIKLCVAICVTREVGLRGKLSHKMLFAKWLRFMLQKCNVLDKFLFFFKCMSILHRSHSRML